MRVDGVCVCVCVTYVYAICIVLTFDVLHYLHYYDSTRIYFTFAHLSPDEPNPHELQSLAGILVLPHHRLHFTQLSPDDPNPHELHNFAG